MEVPLRVKMSSSTFPTLSPSRSSSRNPGKAELPRRPCLAQYHNFDHAVELLKISSRIIVLTGAGISTSLGIKDFRSHDGVYTLLKDKGFDDPQELFDIRNFKDDPKLFFDVVRYLLPPEDTKPGPTHAFIKLLQDQGILLTNYTQNIDDLERQALIEESNVIQVHGSLATAECLTCKKTYKAIKYLPVLRNPRRKDPLRCSRCWGKDGETSTWQKPKKSKSITKKRKRDEFDDDDDDDGPPAYFGVLKPSIVFFGEQVADLFRPRFDSDKGKVDLLIIIGTSLQVEPVKNIPLQIPTEIPQIYIGRERCKLVGLSPDIQLLGQCDIIVEELARRAGWSLKHQMIDPEAAPVRVELMEGTTNQYMVKRFKTVVRTQSSRTLSSHHGASERPSCTPAPLGGDKLSTPNTFSTTRNTKDTTPAN